MSFIIDGHLDIAMDALMYERDQRLSVAEIRRREAKRSGDEPGVCTTTVESMRLANVPVVVTTVIARTKPHVAPDRPATRFDIDYPTHDMAYASALGQLAYYEALRKGGHVRVLRTREELSGHWAQWQSSGMRATAPIGVIITMEGADPLLMPDDVHEWHQRGLRTLMLAHFGPSAYAYGTPSKSAPQDQPLTDMGHALLVEMAALKMPLDLTHLCDRSFFEAVDRFDGVIYSSHSNCRSLVPSVRQLSDEQIKLILERDGVLGIALHNGMLRGPSNGAPAKRPLVGLDAVVVHIDHICQLAGDAKHAAIGSDLDGGFGAEHSPHDLDTCADLHKIGGLLKGRGYSDADIALVLHGNWLRFWLNALPAVE